MVQYVMNWARNAYLSQTLLLLNKHLVPEVWHFSRLYFSLSLEI